MRFLKKISSIFLSFALITSIVVNIPTVVKATTIDFSNAITLNLNSTYEVNIESSNEYQYFKYTPTSTGFYTFESLVEQQDGSFKYYDEDLTEIKSSSSYLNIPEKAYTAFWDKDFVNKYISSNAKLENIYYISGEINQMGTAIYYKTSVGDYVYYNYYSIGEKLFPIEDFCKYQKAISDELAKHSDENGSEDIDISDFMDLAKYELKKVATSSENIKGDANCDGQVDLSDAVMIMQALAR